MLLSTQSTFQNFAETPGTSVALRAIHGLWGRPGLAPHLLLLHGPVGIGKTHLLHAAQDTAAHYAPGSSRVAVVKNLVELLFQAARRKSISLWKDAWVSPRLLLLDDLALDESRSGTQEAIRDVLWTRLQQGKSTVG